MAVALAQARVSASGTSVTSTGTLGANPTVGNILIFTLFSQTNIAAVTAPSTPGGNYTLLESKDMGTGHVSIWARVVTGATEAVTSCTHGGNVNWGTEIYELSGADPTFATAVSVHSSNVSAAVVSLQHTGITPTAGLSGVLIAAIGWTGGTTSAQSVDTGMTAHIATANRSAAAELVVASASGTYAPTWSWTTSRATAVAQVFVQAAPAGAADTTSGFFAWHAARG